MRLRDFYTLVDPLRLGRMGVVACHHEASLNQSHSAEIFTDTQAESPFAACLRARLSFFAIRVAFLNAAHKDAPPDGRITRPISGYTIEIEAMGAD